MVGFAANVVASNLFLVFSLVSLTFQASNSHPLKQNLFQYEETKGYPSSNAQIVLNVTDGEDPRNNTSDNVSVDPSTSTHGEATSRRNEKAGTSKEAAQINTHIKSRKIGLKVFTTTAAQKICKSKKFYAVKEGDTCPLIVSKYYKKSLVLFQTVAGPFNCQSGVLVPVFVGQTWQNVLLHGCGIVTYDDNPLLCPTHRFYGLALRFPLQSPNICSQPANKKLGYRMNVFVSALCLKELSPLVLDSIIE